MHTRFLLTVSAVLVIASVANAEPTKPISQTPAQPAPRPAAVILASAEQAQSPAPAAAQEPEATPAKRPRAARVTSCRCGGQNGN